MKGVLARGGRVRISGFGSLAVVRRRPRKGRNPRSGEVIAIEERRSLVFKPSKILVGRMN